MLLLLAGGLPLLRTAERVAPTHRLGLRQLPFRKIWRDIFAVSAFGIDLTISGSLWSLYLAVFILSGSAAYAKMGIIASVSVLASIAAAYSIGALADRHRGRIVLRLGATVNAILHIVRPFIGAYLPAIALNATDEAATVAYQLPFTKGMYEMGDQLDEYRTAYFTVLEWVASWIKVAVWILLFVLAHVLSAHLIMAIGFFIAACASLLIMTERFKALNP